MRTQKTNRPSACAVALAGTDSDFEDWSPLDGTGQPACVLGRQTSYKRRKATAACAIGADFDDTGRVTVASCSCTADDFEWYTAHCALPGGAGQWWRGLTRPPLRVYEDQTVPRRRRTLSDVGYTPQADGTCATSSPPLQPANCPDGSTYTVPSGYRRLPATSCQGGVALDTAVTKPCSTCLGESRVGGLRTKGGLKTDGLGASAAESGSPGARRGPAVAGAPTAAPTDPPTDDGDVRSSAVMTTAQAKARVRQAGALINSYPVALGAVVGWHSSSCRLQASTTSCTFRAPRCAPGLEAQRWERRTRTQNRPLT